MTDAQYEPTEEEIAKAINRANGHARLLAKAYLRASHRAKAAETRAAIAENINAIYGVMGEAIVASTKGPDHD